MLNTIMSIQPKIISGRYVLEQFTAGIEFKDVYFQYNEHDGDVLRGININIRKGDNIGICGGSGGGKTTFLELIPRFYDVTKGSILIDGVDVKQMDISSLREKIGIVHQTCYIFDNTIRYNITFPLSREVSDEELQKACKSAGILDYIMGLKDGFDTDVGPRGLKLSGGQKQRIQLARLFLVNPDIVILDEATSALDPETELVFQEALAMFKDKTVITVAHRLQTIQDCDKIYVLDSSSHTICESGTHDELMALKGQYYRMQTIKNH